MNYLYLALAITAEVTATSFMKQTDGFTRLVPSLVTLSGYAISFYFLSLTLRDIPTGIAYAIWSGAGIVLITAIAWLFHGQKLDAPAIIGMGLIISGVICMNAFSKAVTHS
jgi:small multidrug resistance pump